MCSFPFHSDKFLSTSPTNVWPYVYCMSINKLHVRLTVRISAIPIIYPLFFIRSIPIGTSLREKCEKPGEIVIHILIFFSPFVHTSSLVFHFFINVSSNLQMSSRTPIHRYTFNIQTWCILKRFGRKDKSITGQDHQFLEVSLGTVYTLRLFTFQND